MYTALQPGTLGIRGLSLPEAVALARDSGHAGLVFDVRQATELAEAQGIDALRALFADAGVIPASWSVPGSATDDPAALAERAELPRYAAVAAALGCARATGFQFPGNDDQTWDEQWERALARIRPVAETLRANGSWYGIEFCGPKTFRDTFAHSFVFSMGGLRELAAAVGTGNVGVLLDAFHLYTAGESVADLEGVPVAEIVAVHVNDAVAGRTADEQIDRERMLPLTTGVIPLAPFMQALQAKGYDGPVVVEPFSAELDALGGRDPRAAADVSRRSLAELWQASGL